MQVETKAQEDEYFKLITKESEEILDDSHVSLVGNEDVLAGRTWCRWSGEYLTPEEIEEKTNAAKEKELELQQVAIQKLKEKQIAEECGQTATIPNVVERRQPTLNNPSGHEWFNGTSWGLK